MVVVVVAVMMGGKEGDGEGNERITRDEGSRKEGGRERWDEASEREGFQEVRHKGFFFLGKGGRGRATMMMTAWW